MDATWIVMCPNWKSNQHINKPHGWSLPQDTLDRIGNRYFDHLIKCICCDREFSLLEGVKEAFISDIPFAIHRFQFNAVQSGEVKVTPGHVKIIEFSQPFEEVPITYLAPHGKPLIVVPGYATTHNFRIFSDATDKEITEEFDVTWSAFGNYNDIAIPIWRKLLSSAKGHQLREDFRSEVVDLESAFEVLVDNYLGERLRNKGWRDETIDWMLKHSIEEKLSKGFIELIGKSLAQVEPEAHGEWVRGVKELRNSVVHRGVTVTKEQAKEARGIVFGLIITIDPSAMEHFRIRIGKSIRKEHPNMTFGTAVFSGDGKKTTFDIAHGLASIPSNVHASESANAEKAYALEDNIKEVKERIRKWTEEENLGLQEISGPDALFNFLISTGTGRTLHIIQSKNKKDSVAIVTSILFENKEKSSLKSKSTIERREILSRLRFFYRVLMPNFTLKWNPRIFQSRYG